MHWASSYIGLPWEAAADGPEAFNCWSFVRHVEAVHYGRELPAIPNPEDLLTLAREFRDNPERRRWVDVVRPADGDCVLLRQARYPVHVGVWVASDGGGVLHCQRDSGVVFQRLPALAASGWRVAGFYRFVGGGNG